jgi:hypothetical protein
MQKLSKTGQKGRFLSSPQSVRCAVANPRGISGHFQIGREICQKLFFRALYAILGAFANDCSVYSEILFRI